jgi:hypothetical protein
MKRKDARRSPSRRRRQARLQTRQRPSRAAERYASLVAARQKIAIRHEQIRALRYANGLRRGAVAVGCAE